MLTLVKKTEVDEAGGGSESESSDESKGLPAVTEVGGKPQPVELIESLSTDQTGNSR